MLFVLIINFTHDIELFENPIMTTQTLSNIQKLILIQYLESEFNKDKFYNMNVCFLYLSIGKRCQKNNLSVFDI